MTSYADSSPNATSLSSSSAHYSACMDLLRGAGLTDWECAIWITVDPEPGRSIAEHVREVTAWHNQFEDAETARDWFDSMILREEAIEWHRAGYSPDDATTIQYQLLRSFARAAKPEQFAPEDQWRATRLPGTWIIECLRTGIVDPDAARRLYEAGRV